MMSDNRNEIIRESIDEIQPSDKAESRMLAHIYSKAAKQKQQDQPVIRRNNFNNIMVEANTNLTQPEITQLMPFDYQKAVTFKQDFLNGF